MRFNNRAFSEAEQLTRLVAIDTDTSGFIKDTEGWRILSASAIAQTLTGIVTETTLATITIPAGALGPNGILRVTTLWSHTNSANNKTIAIRLGGTGGTLYAQYNVTATAATRDERQIHNRNSQSSQVGYHVGGGAAGGWGTNSANAAVTSAVDMSAGTTLVIRGAVPTAAETLTLESYLVEVSYRA